MKLGSLSIIGILFGTAKPAAATPTKAQDLGIKPGNSARTNRKNLLKALTNSNRSISFPPGDYPIDNSGDYVVIRNFGGTFSMDEGARLVFTDRTKRGLMFERGSGAKFYGLRTTFKNLPARRVRSQECILFIQTSGTVVRNATVNGSAAAGMLFGRCKNPAVYNTKITNTMADGLHFANCRDARANEISTYNTGDDGLAFLNYRGGTDYTGGYATNITVKRSRARGIAVVGQRGVTISNFDVDRTHASGLYCAKETSYETRTPSNVLFVGGTVRNAGRASGKPGTNYGIGFYNVKSVKFKDIKVISPATRGVSGVAPGGDVRLVRVRVFGAPEAGFNLAKSNYRLHKLVSKNSGGTGFHIADSGRVRYKILRSINSSREHSFRRAVSLERNRRVRGRRMVVIDRRRRPTGFNVNISGKQSGTAGRVFDRVKRRKVRVQNRSRIRYKVV